MKGDQKTERQKLIDLAHRLGWNGVENSKILSTFFEQYITSLQTDVSKALNLHEEWKVEWIEADGSGHLDEFTSEETARAFANIIAPICMMLDIYRRRVTDWERNP